MRFVKIFSILTLAMFVFNSNASIRLGLRHHPKTSASQMILFPGYAWPPCSACKKSTKSPGKDTPCEVAKGYKCHPGLQKDEKGQWPTSRTSYGASIL